MLFRQLFDCETCTYTYLLADEMTRQAVLIDPVIGLVERDAQLLRELGLQLIHTLETHVHADHITGGAALRSLLGSTTVVAQAAGTHSADVQVTHGDMLQVGRVKIEVRATPGHTAGCVTYVVASEGMAFTGDALMIRGCGRTDFQEGDAKTLYESVHGQILSLPASTRLYPGHDYKGRTVTTVAEEIGFNPRLGGGRTVQEFVAIMNDLGLAYPKHIDVAVPANLCCGLWAPLTRSESGVAEVPTSWVATSHQNHRVVDVRSIEEFVGELGHIRSAKLVPLPTLTQAASHWDKAETIIAVCRSGGRSATAATQLEQLGFQNVASMAGGMLAWNTAGHPIETH